MAVHVIESHPDASKQSTRLELHIPDEPEQLCLDFKYFAGGQWIDAISAYLREPFLLRFRKYQLGSNRMFWGHYDFGAAGRRPAVTSFPAERKIVLRYTATASPVIPARPTDGSVPSDVPDVPVGATFDPITVTITLQAAMPGVNAGWIELDLEHSYPSQIPAHDAAYGWEQTVHFPFLDFRTNPTAITGPVNFSAVYGTVQSSTAVNTATGIAIHLEDVHGHGAFAWYDANGQSLNYELRNSMHLNGRAFVRPAKYSMSAGDAFGFGGNAMRYRVRAFHARGLTAGAPVDWYDVMDIYRTWLHTRFGASGDPSFYNKLRPGRAKNAPVDQMAPHTVISNYGLDGATDPGAPGSAREKMSGWLELHPLRNNAPDTPAAKDNVTFEQLANRLRAKFPNPAAVKLEVQAWGVEQANFYQLICGYPPLTNVISGNGAKYKTGVKALEVNEMTALSITTDPLSTGFNRGRFGGHIRFRAGAPWSEVHLAEHWDALIKLPFPASVRNRNCAATMTKITMQHLNLSKQFDRIWIVEHFPPVEKVPNSPHTAPLNAAQKRNEWGVLQENPDRMASGLYRAKQKQICPTAEVARIYIDDWVKPWVIDQNVRILEFMKHGPAAYFCYRADHQHIVPHPHVDPQTNSAYTNVIGRGSWYTRRLRCILHDVHEKGKAFDADPFCTFRLVFESLPRERLAPYIDEYYSGDEKFDFVYSHMVVQHETPGRGGPGIHPGYKEARKVAGTGFLKLAWMLSPDRDKAPQPLLRTDPKVDLAFRRASFNQWRDQCVDHFNQHVKVAQWGLAPRGYPTSKDPGSDAWNPANPLATTSPRTYTYNRCVQQWFNLRANVFTTGASAVRGRRILIPSQWLEEPRDYDNEALEHAVRAVRMQMDGKQFFRFGRMLGETRIIEVNDAPPKTVWAWGHGLNKTRTFTDVKPLVDHIGMDDTFLLTAWRSVPLLDFISKPWDREAYPDGTYNEIVVTPMIHHRIWQHGEGDARVVLYAFANVSNTPAKVEFLFSRGLQGVTEAAKWQSTIRFYAPAAPPPISGQAWLGKIETVTIPARSFAAVVVKK